MPNLVKALKALAHRSGQQWAGSIMQKLSRKEKWACALIVEKSFRGSRGRKDRSRGVYRDWGPKNEESLTGSINAIFSLPRPPRTRVISPPSVGPHIRMQICGTRMQIWAEIARAKSFNGQREILQPLTTSVVEGSKQNYGSCCTRGLIHSSHDSFQPGQKLRGDLRERERGENLLTSDLRSKGINYDLIKSDCGTICWTNKGLSTRTAPLGLAGLIHSPCPP